MGAKRRKIEESIFEKLSMGLIEFLAAHRVKPITITLSAFILALAASVAYYFAGTYNG